VIELDSEQAKVVESNESMVVVAGPGSGKTRVLTEKARTLIEKGLDIICLCFTRSAAREMGSRVTNLPATTIHSYCNGVVGWDDKWDYPGLLYRFLISDYKRRFDWVLLDECQDVNEMELDVVLSLVGDKIFAVGDPYQSIYGFQGAVGSKILDVLTSLECEVESLHNNYRSSSSIVSYLNKIYKRNLVSKSTRETGLTAILCRTNDDVKYVSRLLERSKISHRLRVSVDRSVDDKREFDIGGESNLRLSTIHVSKGLEFDRVLLFGWPGDKHLYDEEKRCYYVAYSRASKEFREVETIEELIREVTNETC